MWDLTCKTRGRNYACLFYGQPSGWRRHRDAQRAYRSPPFDRVNGGFMNVPPGISSSYIFSLKLGDKVDGIRVRSGEFHPILDSAGNVLAAFYVGGGAVWSATFVTSALAWRLWKSPIVRFLIGMVPVSKGRNLLRGRFPRTGERVPELLVPHCAERSRCLRTTGLVRLVSSTTWFWTITSKTMRAPEDVEYYMYGPGPMAKSCWKDALRFGCTA